MEVGLAALALVVAGLGLALALRVRGELGREQASLTAIERALADSSERLAAAERDATAAKTATILAERTLGELRTELAQARAQLDQLQANLAAPPPLPRARTRNLEDLREQLRAEQEAAPDDDAE